MAPACGSIAVQAGQATAPRERTTRRPAPAQRCPIRASSPLAASPRIAGKQLSSATMPPRQPFAPIEAGHAIKRGRPA